MTRDLNCFFYLYFLSFCSDLFWGCYFKLVAAKQMYTTIEGIKPSSRSVLIFLNELTAFYNINIEPIIFICSYIWKVSLVIFITHSWKSLEWYLAFYVCLIFHAEFDYLWVFKSWFIIFMDYQKRRWDC